MRSSLRMRAFSLLELLAVMLILGVVMAFLVPASNAVLRGSTLTRSGQLVGDQIALARQVAIAGNCTVYVRFYKLQHPGDPKSEFCALQLFTQEASYGNDSALNVKPVAKLEKLNSNIIISDSEELSTLLGDNAPLSGAVLVDGVSVPYKGFRFRPDGSTDLNVTTSDGWFLTLINRSPTVTPGEVPKNFYTIRVDPYTGRTRLFRP